VGLLIGVWIITVVKSGKHVQVCTTRAIVTVCITHTEAGQACGVLTVKLNRVMKIMKRDMLNIFEILTIILFGVWYITIDENTMIMWWFTLLSVMLLYWLVRRL
jgi:hypothetical protein